jgi:hypothetical protein
MRLPSVPDQITPELQAKIDKLIKFFEGTAIKYDKYDPDFLKGTSLSEIEEKSKQAYPNIDYMHVPGQHDTHKWLQAIKDIYYGEKNGLDRVAAIRQSTKNWEVTETYDFLNWLKFYEEGAHLKYKFAQLWYENGAPGYFLHIKPDQKKEETQISGKDIDDAKDAIADEMSAAEKKRVIEKQRNKIVGRLDSAEKLLRSYEGQIFAGKELESLLETIYQLKKKLQMVNKISLSTKLYDDMIIREANVLSRKGYADAAELLYSLAQANNPPPPATGVKKDTPINPSVPPMPHQNSGAPGGLPSTGPGMAQNPPESAPSETSSGMSAFLKNLDTSNIGDVDDQANEDELEVEDTLHIEDEALLTVAQDMPAPPAAPPPTPAPKPVKPPTETPLEVDEKNLGVQPSQQVKDFDNMIDAAFANISVDDIVAKLEDIAKIFKTREIPRQLSIIDMMLDSKGLASYFPSLSEAINKALESNNYISTRIDDILAKLQGGIEGKDLDLKGERGTANTPEVESLKSNLKQREDKEKARKKMRQDQADQELEQSMNPAPEKETPEVNIEEDLNKPVTPRPTTPPAPRT